MSEKRKQKETDRDSTIANKRIFLELLEQSRGMITAVCARLGISRATYYVWMKSDKKFKQQVEEIVAWKPQLIEELKTYLIHKKIVAADEQYS